MTTVKPYEEKEENFIYFKIRRQDWCTYFKCMDKLEEIFEKEKLVGARSIYHKMIALLLPKEEDMEQYHTDIIQQLTGKVVSYFIKDKSYTFEIKKQRKNEAYDEEFKYMDVETGKVPFKMKSYTRTSQDMISQAVSCAVYTFLSRETKTENKDKKEEVIRTCYVNIVNYISKEKELSKIITHYKATVLSGYIAMQLGFTLSADLKPLNVKEIPPTNEQIYNAVKYFTAPLNPAKKIK